MVTRGRRVVTRVGQRPRLHGPRSMADEEEERAVYDLLQQLPSQCEAAPTFGANARHLLLQAVAAAARFDRSRAEHAQPGGRLASPAPGRSRAGPHALPQAPPQRQPAAGAPGTDMHTPM